MLKVRIMARLLTTHLETLLLFAKSRDSATAFEKLGNDVTRRAILHGIGVSDPDEKSKLKLVSDVIRELRSAVVVMTQDGEHTHWIERGQRDILSLIFGRVSLVPGDAFVGTFRDGQICGPGLYRYGNGEYAYGTFKDGVLHGHDGTLVERNPVTQKLDIISQGEFVNGDRERIITYTEGNKAPRQVHYCKDKPKKKRSRGSSSTSSKALKKKAASAAESAAQAEERAKVAEDEQATAAAAAQQAHSYSFEVFTSKDIKKNPTLVPKEYLAHQIVRGKDQPPINADDLQLIDNAVFLKVYMSPLGSVDKQLIGCRQVAYFEPLNMIVLNTTVIFDAHQKQKNLDPLQKCTSDYIHEKYPDATRLAVVTSPELSVANWNNYTTNGFPWNKGDGTYDYLDMVNIDDESYKSDEHDAGPKDAWDIWANGKICDVEGWDTVVSGGYGQYGFTLVATLPRK